MCVVWLLLCDGQRMVSQGFGTVRDLTLCSKMEKSQSEWQMRVCPNFRTPLRIGRVNFELPLLSRPNSDSLFLGLYGKLIESKIL